MIDRVDFYAVAAQVIPVLFLAATFESRYLTKQPSHYAGDKDDPGNWNLTQAVGRIFSVIALVVAEAAALVGLFAGPSTALDAFVIVGLAFGFLLVIGPMVGAQIRYIGRGLAGNEARTRRIYEGNPQPEVDKQVKTTRRREVGLLILIAVSLAAVSVFVVDVVHDALSATETGSSAGVPISAPPRGTATTQ
ncbi:hypothetical protein [Cellulomonas sp. Y8]|uniref:hypothetical protein n=1 Tax=Cellulomonas sp. Y8 TaxID=2591145 RepID=UPI003D740770